MESRHEVLDVKWAYHSLPMARPRGQPCTGLHLGRFVTAIATLGEGLFTVYSIVHCRLPKSERYFAYSNSGLAFKASLVAPGKTSLPSTSLNLETATATSCSAKPRQPLAWTMA